MARAYWPRIGARGPVLLRSAGRPLVKTRRCVYCSKILSRYNPGSACRYCQSLKRRGKSLRDRS